jgi:hypothetical protein
MTRVRVLAAVAALATLLTACSGASSGGSGGSSPGASSSAGASPAASGSASASGSVSASPSGSVDLTEASADEILAQARAAFLAAPSVHAKGVLLTDGTSYTLDLRLVKGRGAVGTVGSKGGRLTLVRVGNAAYVSLDAASLRAATGSAEAARRYAGKYFSVTSSNRAAFRPFLALTDAGKAFGPALAPTGTVTKGSVSTVNGRRVVDLLVDGGSSGDVFVALDGRPYPVRIGYGKGGQHVDFDSYGAKVALAKPPASKLAPTPGG